MEQAGAGPAPRRGPRQPPEGRPGGQAAAGILARSCQAWSSRNRASRGTGRPVAPLSLPPRQAVPAMSRWAQRYALAKRDRKQAAVTEPAGGPPLLAMSAKFDLSWSW